MKYLFSLAAALAAFFVFVFRWKKKKTPAWKSDCNRGYYQTLKDGKLVKKLDKDFEHDKSLKFGLVAGNGEVPIDFIFKYQDSFDILEIEKIENEVRTKYPDLHVEVCDCSPRLRRYYNFPIGIISKSGEKLTVGNGSTKEGDVEFSNVIGFAPNYRLQKGPSGFETLKTYRGETSKYTWKFPGIAINEEDKFVKIAVLDTGYGDGTVFPNFSLQDPCILSSKYFNNPIDDDDTKHGTFVTELILKQLPENVRVGIIPVKVLNSAGNGSIFDLICALSSLKGKKVDIINASLGYYAPKEDQVTNEFIGTCIKETGALFFAAAGNESPEMDVLDGTHSRNLSVRNLLFFPACLKNIPNLISVTSSVESRRSPGLLEVCDNQNYSPQYIKVAVRADSSCGFLLSGSLMNGTGIGTSFATPVAAGKAAAKIAGGAAVNPNLLSQIASPQNWISPAQVSGNNTIIP
ncbi:S8/S53 family peptidase [Dyadobacter sp. LHD-138]|uniref:S8/S53 family peptidase n=1 Tax=Dyadobacter sp. LHD-138 TaxID=3071413 RepID=UPI0027E04951|nr:S8/S53 family peptidase [Dyadobacter sp. LHD-138]MDQ6478696.1 S8/S53 family peptidase [Dyadobacter sp. LHD-138]